MSVSDNLKSIQSAIASHVAIGDRIEREVTIIGVTKYVSSERAREAVEAGITHLGENRKEGLLNKQAELKNDSIYWHFIGSLQTRKVKDVINHIDYLHSLDRLSLAKEIQKRLNKENLDCFVQLNLSGESSKHGLAAEDLLGFIESLKAFSKIRVTGLMTMAAHTEDEDEIRSVFRKLKACQQQVLEKNFTHAPCRFLSMGMSNDYTIAVEEGAHFVRIGTALVGKE